VSEVRLVSIFTFTRQRPLARGHRRAQAWHARRRPQTGASRCRSAMDAWAWPRRLFVFDDNGERAENARRVSFFLAQTRASLFPFYGAGDGP
jgi:hypothetical protein